MPRRTLTFFRRQFLEPVAASIAILLLVISGFVTLQNLSRIWGDVGRVSSSNNVLTSLDSLSICLREAESGQQVFSATGDESYFDSYTAAESKLTQLLSELSGSFDGDPEQQELFERLKQTIEAKRADLAELVRLRRSQSNQTPTNEARGSTSKQTTAQVDNLIASIRSTAHSNYSLHLAETEQNYRTAWLTGLILTISGLALVGGLIWAIFRQRRLSEKNRELDQHMRWFIEQISDYAIFTMDVNCKATTWNDGVRQVVGFEEREFLGRDVRPLIFTPEAHASGVVEAEFKNAAQNGSSSDDRWMRRKDDSLFWASGITSSIRNRSGELVGFSKVMRDMTEQKQNSDQLSRLAAELSQESRRKNEFLATLAHELRNPLSPIKNAVELMSTMSLSSELDELRIVMDRHVEQLVRLIEDLMDVSRIGRGKIDLRKQVVEIRCIVDEAVESSQPLIDSNEQHLTINVPDNGLLVDVDRTRMTQVICNLLNNASKYSDVDCNIAISAERVGEHVVLTVQDDGSGISADRIDDIFEMYSQIEDSVERGTAGLGIGLTLVRTLVELHGGTVAAASEGVDKGSTFTIKLPIAIPEGTLAQEDDKPVNVAKEFAHRRVLVVDDMRALSMVLSSLLKTLGHDVRVVASGKAAIEALHTFDAEVVFSDIAMPGMTGYELATYLRSEYSKRSIILVAMTGYGQASDREKALAAGFDEHMVKPVDFKVLKTFFQKLG